MFKCVCRKTKHRTAAPVDAYPCSFFQVFSYPLVFFLSRLEPDKLRICSRFASRIKLFKQLDQIMPFRPKALLSEENIFEGISNNPLFRAE